ncbi:MAG: HDIG domain-containing protein [Firmicutes bacterium]|nr:HDIG domain-containing protein [Bacillota bacterium]
MKSRWLHIILTILAFAMTITAIAGGAYFRAGLDVTISMPSAERIRAPHIMENTRQTEANRQAAWEAAERLEPVYTINEAEWQFVDLNLSVLHNDVLVIRDAYRQEVLHFQQALAEWEDELAVLEAEFNRIHREWEIERDAAIEAELDPPPEPGRSLPPNSPQWLEEYLELFLRLHMLFSETEQRILATIEDEDFELLWGAVVTVAETVQLTQQINVIDVIIERAVLRTLTDLLDVTLNRAAEELVVNIVLHHLRPNVIPDEERNLQRFDEHRRNYVAAWIQPRDIIVDEGEIVTEDIYFILEQFGLLRSESIQENFIPLIGVAALVMVLFLICIMYLTFYYPAMAGNKKEALLLFTVFTLSLTITWVLREFNLPVIALLIFPMLVSLLIDRKCAMVLSFAMVLICFFVVEGSLAYLLFYTTAGALICLLSRFGTERSKVFLVGLLVTAGQFALSIAVALIIERAHALSDIQGLLVTAAFAAASGMFTVIVCTGSLPFWETVFGVVTPIKLLDLTNPTNILLRRLTIEAPGTYHHSLIVANLAETAAYDIGASAHTARVGGYYHDIGKLKSPHYFAENLDGENPHDLLDPITSAQLIISHVSHGMSLATEHRLPQFVRDIIKEHHGTTLLQFFYTKAMELNPNVDPMEYRYPYVIPQTRESACVMLADSVEAAVRATMPKSNSLDDVEKTIRKVIRDKLNDGQLADSQLSIKDVTVIEQSFFRVLKGMYHERIAYPKTPKPASKEDLI